MLARRSVCLFLLVCFVFSFPAFAPAASVSAQTVPPLGTLSLTYSRLGEALSKGDAVRFEASVTPEAMEGYEGAALSGMAALLSALTISGEVASDRDGEHFQASLLSGGAPVLTLGRATDAERVGFLVGDQWINARREETDRTAAMLDITEIAETLAAVSYDDLLAGEMPFLSTLNNRIMTLWTLASPYGEDNTRLSVPSGSTSHATTYKLETDAVREVLSAFAREMTAEGLRIGGGALSLGVEEAAFEALRARLAAYAQTPEVTSPITLNMTFGEGDMLRTVRGSGTLRDEAGRAPFSLSYTATPRGTRTSTRLSLDFQPKGASDTLKASYSAHESADGKRRAAADLTLTLTGLFDGKPYRVAVEYDMGNRFTLADDGTITEALTGTLTASVRYDDVKALEIEVRRAGEARSAPNAADLAIRETFTLTIEREEAVFFSGDLRLAFSIAPQPDARLDLAAAPAEAADFDTLSALRNGARAHLSGFRARLIDALPPEALEGILNAY